MKKRYQVIFILLALTLLYIVLNKIGFRNILESLKLLKWYYLILAIGINLLIFLTWNYKWRLLVNKVSKVKFWELFPILMTGVFFNTATPTANMGGEPLRVHYLGKRFKKEKSKYLATVIIDKITNAGTSLIFVLFSVLFASLFIKIPTTIKVLTQSLVTIGLLILGIFIFYKKVKLEKILKLLQPFFKKRFPTKKEFEKYVQEKKEEIKKVLKEFYTCRKSLGKEFSLGILMQLLTFSKAYVLFIALGQNVNPLYVILTVSIALMIGQLIIVPGGIGIVESSMISMYALLGINANIAATVAILDRVIYYIFALGLGYVSFMYVDYKHK